MRPHRFDPISLILGLAFGGLGLYFLFGDRTAADIGWKWLWPVPVLVIGALFVVSAVRRLVPEPEREPEGTGED